MLNLTTAAGKLDQNGTLSTLTGYTVNVLQQINLLGTLTLIIQQGKYRHSKATKQQALF
jgi:hypothetical protein